MNKKPNLALPKDDGVKEKKPNFFLPCGRKIYIENGPPESDVKIPSTHELAQAA